MVLKKSIKYINTVIEYCKFFINNAKSNNLLVYELRNHIKNIQTLLTDNDLFFTISDIQLDTESNVKSFKINNIAFVFDYTNIDNCIEKTILLKKMFKNILIYYEEVYKHKNTCDLYSTIIYIFNTYTNIFNTITKFVTTNDNTRNLYIDLIKIISEYKKIDSSFVLKNSSLYIYYYKKNDFYEKIKLQKLDLISMYNISDECQDNKTFTVFKKNPIPNMFYENFILKIGIHKVFFFNKQNQNQTIQINILLDLIKNEINKIIEYKKYIENIFNLDKCLFIKEAFEKYIEFFIILNVDIENLLLFSQTECYINNAVIISSYQNLINNLYSRFNGIINSINNRLDISNNSKNIDLYYKDTNGNLVFFGLLNNLTQNAINDNQGDISSLTINVSTLTLTFNSFKNQNLSFENFELNLLENQKNLEIIKTLVELNLKTLCDLIFILSQV